MANDWAKELLADVADEQWDNEVEMTFAAREHLLRVLERRLLGLLEAGAMCRGNAEQSRLGDMAAEAWDAAMRAAKAVASEGKARG